LQPAADSKKVRIEFVAKSPSVESAVDPDRLQQVVWNLLSNAIKFTPASGVVRITLELKQNEVCIVVSDNGQGIDAEFLPYVFERFSQADSTNIRTYGGLGIGLAIVRHIVELHGGHVTATSNGKDQGSTFTITLAARTTEVPAASSIPKRNPERPSSLKDLRILLVEDEADTRELLATVLRSKGAIVIPAGSVQEALAALQANLPSILISDIAMPDENGYILLGKLRKLEAAHGWPRIPAIALTAYAREEDRKAALDAGFEVHISKPFDPAKLIAATLDLAIARFGKAI
jgi:CheY-like chemotaxis protein